MITCKQCGKKEIHMYHNGIFKCISCIANENRLEKNAYANKKHYLLHSEKEDITTFISLPDYSTVFCPAGWELKEI